LTVELPAELPAGDYRVSVFNGYRGQVEGRDAGLIRIAPHAPVWKHEPFDVTAFGAIANDGMDDTDAIQAALDAAGANGGGTVLIPRGRFEINDPIRIPRFVLLKGAGMKLSQPVGCTTPATRSAVCPCTTASASRPTAAETPPSSWSRAKSSWSRAKGRG
ncbi:MAG: glycoside hydrolase family 55 protein, partial [Pirellulaceae bacterium]|nr:glycoside hydrolase family 55 protein [Pirellulaceae bacterium]